MCVCVRCARAGAQPRRTISLERRERSLPRNARAEKKEFQSVSPTAKRQNDDGSPPAPIRATKFTETREEHVRRRAEDTVSSESHNRLPQGRHPETASVPLGMGYQSTPHHGMPPANTRVYTGLRPFNQPPAFPVGVHRVLHPSYNAEPNRYLAPPHFGLSQGAYPPQVPNNVSPAYNYMTAHSMGHPMYQANAQRQIR
eukprot:GHVU01182587.1.p1 GENE.GHVU01182587.1~~GHVU01182587.1.p1  ORF type:complete len:199 (-),score=6.95 GHVU01182587.1:622-1218(-)